jgi:hypothetical protein
MFQKNPSFLVAIVLGATCPLALAEEKPAAPAASPARKEAETEVAPEIADPVVKRLVEEGRKARAEDDIAKAIVKLDEARERAPKDPNVLAEQAVIFEEMAKCDPALKERAIQNWEEIFKLGKEKAGALYHMAGKRLADGI